MNHLNTREIRRFRLNAGGAESKARLLHLLTCSHCRRRAAVQTALNEEWALGEATPAEALTGRSSPLLERAIATFNGDASASRRDRERAEPLYAEVRSLPPERRQALLASDSRFESAGLGLLLLEGAEIAAPEDPAEAESLAELAREIAARLGSPRGGFVSAGLAGAAWCWIAEAHRLRGELAGADAAYEQARRHLEMLPPFATERADFCRLSARLRRDQARDDEAFSLLVRALEMFESYPSPERAGECALDLGWMYLEELETAEALPLFEQAAGRFPEPSEFAPWLSVRHGLALCYADLQWDDHLAALLDDLRRTAPALGALDRLRVAAVEADVAQSTDDNERAATLLARVWIGFRQEGAVFEAARTLLDLARLHIEQERSADLDRLGAGLVSLFDLPPRTHEVLAFAFGFARRHGLAAVEILELAKRHLRSARHSPDLPFSLLRHPAPEVQWAETDPAFRLNAVADAELPESVAQETPPSLRPEEQRRLGWAVAATLGLELRFAAAAPGEGEPAGGEASSVSGAGRPASDPFVH